MATLRNLVRVHSATVGAGVLTLGAAVTGFLTFAQAGVLDGETVSYGIFDYDGAGNHTDSEVGRGVYNAGAGTLTRNVLDSTNGGAALNLSGNEHVFIPILTEDMDHASGSIANVGTNTHAQIDTHIADVLTNPHNVTAAQVGAPPTSRAINTTSPLSGGGDLSADRTLLLLATIANKILYSTGVNTWSETDLTAFMRTLLDDPDAATALTTLGAAGLFADTYANIMAAAKGAGQLALCTETNVNGHYPLYISLGAGAWALLPFAAILDSESPDMGPDAENNRLGYGSDYISDKTLSNVQIGNNSNANEGGIWVDPSTSPKTLYIRLNSTNNTILYDFSIALGYLVHYPFSTTQAVKVWSGMSIEVGLNGRPIINEYEVDMGAFPAPRVLNGGTF